MSDLVSIPRENNQGYIEFGSVMAVGMLIDQVLRDLPAPAAQQEVENGKS